MAEKKSNHYLSAKEIRRIAKENAKTVKTLEKYKNRRAKEEEFLTEMNDPENILEIDDLHTYFFTDQGVVKAVNGVSYNVPKHSRKRMRKERNKYVSYASYPRSAGTDLSR